MSEKMDMSSWRTMPIGGIVTDPGSSTQYDSGGWRALRPVVDMDKCTHCMICWIFCPDSSIKAENMRFAGIDLDHCKGCGICAVECPPKAIQMVNEVTFREES